MSSYLRGFLNDENTKSSNTRARIQNSPHKRKILKISSAIARKTT